MSTPRRSNTRRLRIALLVASCVFTAAAFTSSLIIGCLIYFHHHAKEVGSLGDAIGGIAGTLATIAGTTLLAAALILQSHDLSHSLQTAAKSAKTATRQVELHYTQFLSSHLLELSRTRSDLVARETLLDPHNASEQRLRRQIIAQIDQYDSVIRETRRIIQEQSKLPDDLLAIALLSEISYGTPRPLE